MMLSQNKHMDSFFMLLILDGCGKIYFSEFLNYKMIYKNIYYICVCDKIN